jgi:UrcA family protein
MSIATFSNFRRAATCLAIMATASFASLPGYSSELKSVKVLISDLNLSRPADAQLLYRRLRTAAATVCGEVDHRDLARLSAWNQCYRHALQGAVDSLDAPVLLAVHRQMNNQEATPKG